MFETDFFSKTGLRSIKERREKLTNFIPNPSKRMDFLGYGYNYYDNADYGVGYGGYYYDGRYADSVAKMVAHYSLKPGDKVLEIGCAKGFVLYEFLNHDLDVAGIDYSTYALENAVPSVRPFLVRGSCVDLPWPDDAFDFVYAKEILPHLQLAELTTALFEMVRVSKAQNIFLEIQVVEDAKGGALMKIWDETHQIIETVEWWQAFLEELNFSGQIHFKQLF